jgi:selenocysteine lyase/cysteine desulfurase
MTPTQLRETIPVLSELVYLNCGWAGPVPTPVLRAVQETLELEASQGPATSATLPALEAHFRAARRELARLLGTGPERIALTGNATSGLCIVASGLDWRPGDEVVIADQEHPSNALPWYHLGRQSGIVVREVRVREDTSRMLEDFRRAIAPRTRVVAVSHVQWSTGQVMPLRALADMVHAQGGWLVVDAAQSAGQLPAKVEDLGADCYSVPGQKWLLGPSGTGGVCFSPPLIEELSPSHVGWASVSEHEAGGRFRLWPGGRRFETATASAALHAGLARAVEIIREMGVDTVQDCIQRLVTYLRDRLDRVPNLRVLSPAQRELRTGLLTVQIADADAESAVRQLFHEHQVVARSVSPLEAVRFSIHAYNTDEEMERVAAALAQLSSS